MTGVDLVGRGHIAGREPGPVEPATLSETLASMPLLVPKTRLPRLAPRASGSASCCFEATSATVACAPNAVLESCVDNRDLRDWMTLCKNSAGGEAEYCAFIKARKLNFETFRRYVTEQGYLTLAGYDRLARVPKAQDLIELRRLIEADKGKKGIRAGFALARNIKIKHLCALVDRNGTFTSFGDNTVLGLNLFGELPLGLPESQPVNHAAVATSLAPRQSSSNSHALSSARDISSTNRGGRDNRRSRGAAVVAGKTRWRRRRNKAAHADSEINLLFRTFSDEMKWLDQQVQELEGEFGRPTNP